MRGGGGLHLKYFFKKIVPTELFINNITLKKISDISWGVVPRTLPPPPDYATDYLLIPIIMHYYDEMLQKIKRDPYPDL